MYDSKGHLLLSRTGGEHGEKAFLVHSKSSCSSQLRWHIDWGATGTLSVSPRERMNSNKDWIAERVVWDLLHSHYSLLSSISLLSPLQPHRCDQCPQTFNVEFNLTLHKSTHTTSDFTCPVCNKKFSRIASLKSHVMLHEKEEVSQPTNQT